MQVTVLFFAQARDHAGRGKETIEVSENARVADALALVRQRYPALEPLWPHLAIAVDGELAGADARVRPGSEIALLPPVSGG